MNTQEAERKSGEAGFRAATGSAYFDCACGCAILRFNKDEDGDVEVAIYRDSWRNRMRFWKRIKYCLKVLCDGKPYGDDMILSEEDAARAGNFLQNAELSNRANQENQNEHE